MNITKNSIFPNRSCRNTKSRAIPCSSAIGVLDTKLHISHPPVLFPTSFPSVWKWNCIWSHKSPLPQGLFYLILNWVYPNSVNRARPLSAFMMRETAAKASWTAACNHGFSPLFPQIAQFSMCDPPQMYAVLCLLR